ncbi:DUF6262 family protein [Streptomyces xanthophaeus]|uniref:DUF6262 family protein n=1 Tax=Streptomyces xanthophaeus TaxID=67385 RepID=UPI0039901FA3
MSQANTRSTAMVEGRRADSLRRRERVTKALQNAVADGTEISISAIARTAKVDRSFFYRPQHRDLLAQIQAAAAEPRTAPGVGPAVSRASLLADLANGEERNKRLAERVLLLEKRLSEAIGEDVWKQAGLGTPDDADGLKRQIVALEEANADLRLKLEEAADDLAAARGTNRELMAQLNAGGRTGGR